MAGKRILLIVGGGIALASSSVASACSIVWVPYLQSRPKDVFAIRVETATIEFAKFEESKAPWSLKGTGTIYLRGIHCLSRPKGEKVCPVDLDIPFDGMDDGANCGFYGQQFGPNKPLTDRYFYLRKAEGKWLVTSGARRIEEL